MIKEFFKLSHIHKHPITTYIGIFLLAIAAYSIYHKRNIGAEDITLIGIALALFPARDPNKPNSGSAAVMVLILSLFMTGCVTSRKCLDKFGSDTLRIYDTLTVRLAIPVPPDSLLGEVADTKLDSLKDGSLDSLVSVSESQNLTIKFWYDKYSKALKYSANKKPDTVVVTRRVPFVVDCPPVVVVDQPKPRWHEKVWKNFQFFSAFLVLGGLCLIIIRLVYKRMF